MDGEMLVRIAVEVGCGFVWGDPRSQVPQTPENRAAWTLLEEEFADAPGLYDIPLEVPDFDLYDESLLKHYGGPGHEQLSHGSWAWGVMRDTPEWNAKMTAVGATPKWDLTKAYREYESITSLYYGDEEEFVRRYMTETLEATIESVRETEGVDEEVAEQTAIDLILSDQSLVEFKFNELVARLEPKIREQVADAFNWKGDGWESKVSQDVTVEPEGEIRVNGLILDDDGKMVGEWTRTIYPPGVASQFKTDVGETVVYHDSFVMNDDGAGKGIGRKFIDHLENLYLNNGVDAIGVSAVDLSFGDMNKPGGPAVWASMGFDFLNRRQAEGVGDAVRRYLLGDEFKALPSVMKDAVNDVYARLRSEDAGELPTPREVWMLGRLPGSTWWPGKAILGHSGYDEVDAEGEPGPAWDGVKRFVAGGMRVTEAEVRHQQMLERVDDVARNRAFRQAINLAGVEVSPDGFVMIDGQPVPLFRGDMDYVTGASDD